jgi:hypothetical protein
MDRADPPQDVVAIHFGSGLPGQPRRVDLQIWKDAVTQGERTVAEIESNERGTRVTVREASRTWAIAQTDGRRPQTVVTDDRGSERARFHPRSGLLAGGSIEAGTASWRLRRKPLTGRWVVRGAGVEATLGAYGPTGVRLAIEDGADVTLIIPLLVVVTWVIEATRINTGAVGADAGGV